jgi:gluconolactonase
MSDGSVVLVEIGRGTVTRAAPDGSSEVVAELGGGPNGAAIGPDGKLYVCNNGGAFDYTDMDGLTVPVQPPQNHTGGRIERVDLDSGEVEMLYDECDGTPLRAPNDLVFDAHGGFYFTDHGLREHRTSDRTGVFYADPTAARSQRRSSRSTHRTESGFRQTAPGSTSPRPTPPVCGGGS